MKRFAFATLCLTCHLVAVAAEPVPIDFERLKADSLAQHRDLLKWEKEELLPRLNDFIRHARAAGVDESLPIRKIDREEVQGGVKTVSLGDKREWSIYGRDGAGFQSEEMKRQQIARLESSRQNCKARINEAMTGRRGFIPFLREPFRAGQVGRFQHQVDIVRRVNGSEILARTTFGKSEDSEHQIRLTELSYEWIDFSTGKPLTYLTLDYDDCVFQYIGIKRGMHTFVLLDDPLAYEAFRYLNSDRLVP